MKWTLDNLIAIQRSEVTRFRVTIYDFKNLEELTKHGAHTLIYRKMKVNVKENFLKMKVRKGAL